MYSEYANMDLLIIHRENKKSEYKFSEFHFGKENFMHLTGCQGVDIKAAEFFEKCLNRTITKTEYNFIHNRNTAHSKLLVLPELLNLKEAKIFKIGNKDLITLNNKFIKAIGNYREIIGFDRRHKVHKYLIPVTCICKDIREYVSRPNNIVFVFKKTSKKLLYDNLHYSIKRNILVKDLLPSHIESKLDPSLLRSN